jgi:hypothetical protein
MKRTERRCAQQQHRQQHRQQMSIVAKARPTTTTTTTTTTNGDIVGQQHAQQLDLLRSVYTEAPQAVWQSAATRALEVNALLMAAVVGEQRRAEQERDAIERRVRLDEFAKWCLLLNPLPPLTAIAALREQVRALSAVLKVLRRSSEPNATDDAFAAELTHLHANCVARIESAVRASPNAGFLLVGVHPSDVYTTATLDRHFRQLVHLVRADTDKTRFYAGLFLIATQYRDGLRARANCVASLDQMSKQADVFRARANRAKVAADRAQLFCRAYDLLRDACIQLDRSTHAATGADAVPVAMIQREKICLRFRAAQVLYESDQLVNAELFAVGALTILNRMPRANVPAAEAVKLDQLSHDIVALVRNIRSAKGDKNVNAPPPSPARAPQQPATVSTTTIMAKQSSRAAVDAAILPDLTHSSLCVADLSCVVMPERALIKFTLDASNRTAMDTKLDHSNRVAMSKAGALVVGSVGTVTLQAIQVANNLAMAQPAVQTAVAAATAATASSPSRELLQRVKSALWRSNSAAPNANAMFVVSGVATILTVGLAVHALYSACQTYRASAAMAQRFDGLCAIVMRALELYDTGKRFEALVALSLDIDKVGNRYRELHKIAVTKHDRELVAARAKCDEACHAFNAAFSAFDDSSSGADLMQLDDAVNCAREELQRCEREGGNVDHAQLFADVQASGLAMSSASSADSSNASLCQIDLEKSVFLELNVDAVIETLLDIQMAPDGVANLLLVIADCLMSPNIALSAFQRSSAKYEASKLIEKIIDNSSLRVTGQQRVGAARLRDAAEQLDKEARDRADGESSWLAWLRSGGPLEWRRPDYYLDDVLQRPVVDRLNVMYLMALTNRVAIRLLMGDHADEQDKTVAMAKVDLAIVANSIDLLPKELADRFWSLKEFLAIFDYEPYHHVADSAGGDGGNEPPSPSPPTQQRMIANDSHDSLALFRERANAVCASVRLLKDLDNTLHYCEPMRDESGVDGCLFAAITRSLSGAGALKTALPPMSMQQFVGRVRDIYNAPDGAKSLRDLVLVMIEATTLTNSIAGWSAEFSLAMLRERVVLDVVAAAYDLHLQVFAISKARASQCDLRSEHRSGAATALLVRVLLVDEASGRFISLVSPDSFDNSIEVYSIKIADAPSPELYLCRALRYCRRADELRKSGRYIEADRADELACRDFALAPPGESGDSVEVERARLCALANVRSVALEWTARSEECWKDPRVVRCVANALWRGECSAPHGQSASSDFGIFNDVSDRHSTRIAERTERAALSNAAEVALHVARAAVPWEPARCRANDSAARFVLSLDGGGTRGVSTCAILCELERHIGRPLAAQFDLISGTSTGGIIALALAAPLAPSAPSAPPTHARADSVLHMYMARAQEIFGAPRTAVSQYHTSKYASDSLARMVRERVGERLLSDCATEVLVPAVKLDQLGVVSAFSKRDFGKMRLFDVALATSAAPTFLPAHRIDSVAYPLASGTYVDGGLRANNPAALAVGYAVDELQWDERQLSVLSIGTGYYEPDPLVLGAHSGLIYWAVALKDAVLPGQEYQTHRDLLSRAKTLASYVRIDPKLDKPIVLDATDDATLRTLYEVGCGAFEDALADEHGKLTRLIDKCKGAFEY